MASDKPLDLLLSFDETGSMRPCTHEVRVKIAQMAAALFEDMPHLRIGLIAHGDYCDTRTYITKHLPFTTSPKVLEHFLNTLESVSGGDAPEAYEVVLHEAREVAWRSEAQKVLVMIGDEVPHGFAGYDTQARYDWQKEIAGLNAEAVTVHGVQCLNNRHATPFYKAISATTGGKYLTLQQFGDILQLINLVAYYQDDRLDQYVEKMPTVSRGVSGLIAQLRGEVGAADDFYVGKHGTASLDAVSPYRFQVLTVGSAPIGIKEFVTRSGATFKIGRGFYEFTKTETVQGYKEVVLRDRVTGDMFSGDKAREIAGLPIGYTTRLRPHILGKYQVFVQSTSPNRKLMPNTSFLYEVEKV